MRWMKRCWIAAAVLLVVVTVTLPLWRTVLMAGHQQREVTQATDTPDMAAMAPVMVAMILVAV